MNATRFVIAMLGTLMAFGVPQVLFAENDRPSSPNILLIVADDLGWSDVGWHGGFAKTPNMDRLVKEGVELDHHYVQPVCTPTRTALMSGRYPGRFGPQALAPSNLRAMPLGTLTMASADDGMHADAALTVNGGAITITNAYEGLESAVITLNGGSVTLNASDDGVNASSGDGGGFGMSAASAGTYLYINGGYLAVNAVGDGIDVNGAITMTGGVVVVNGPTEQMNGALDFDAGFTMTGGWLVAAGSAGMVQTLNDTSTQPSLLLNFTATQAAGTLVHLQSSDGTDVLTFAPSKAYQSITFSSPELTQGTYDVYLGGSSDGTATDGVYSGGSYTGGTLYTNFTVSSMITTVGSAGGMGMGGGRGARGGGRP
ncbi:MAG: sulfatase-like hydrolase/transferase [Anaerolineae bacterium]|nr:sulfatase-like hydrolase/transferase [Anaerolineae bacterium]